MGICGGKVSNLDWMEFSGYHQAARHTSVNFAGAAGPVHVPVEGGERRTTYESFEKGGFWLVRNRDDLGQTVEDLMFKMCCRPLNDNAFFTGLSSSVLERLADGGPRRRRDTVQNPLSRRHALRFQGACPPITDPRRPHGLPRKGDLRGDQALRAHPGFFEGACGDGGVSAASKNGKQVIACFAGRVRDPPPHEGVRGLGLRPVRAASHDQDHLRNAAVLQDVLHLGSQDSGKDTKVNMLHAFLGHGNGKDNYGVQLPGNYVAQQTRYLTAKARALPWPVKSPSTTRWRMTSSSPFVTWKVRQSATALLVATSNYPPRVT